MKKATVLDARDVQTALEELGRAVDETLRKAEGSPLPLLADRLIEQRAELIHALTPAWQRQAVLTLFRQKRRRLGELERERQLTFPQFEKQFDRIPRRLPIAAGKPVLRDSLTYTLARQYLATLRKSQNDLPKLTQAKTMTALLRKYSREQPAVTWAEVVALEAAKAKGKS